MKVVKVKEAVKEFVEFLKKEDDNRVMALYGGALIRFYISKRKSGYNEFFLRDDPYVKAVQKHEGWTEEDLKAQMTPETDSGEAVILKFLPAIVGIPVDDPDAAHHGIQPWPIKSLTDEELLNTWVENFENCGSLGTISYCGPYLYKGEADKWANNENLQDYAVIIGYITEDELQADIEEWRKNENHYTSPTPTEEWFMDEVEKL